MKTFNLFIGLGSLIVLSGCGSIDSGRTGRTSEGIACASNDDCDAGFECEAEDNGSFCKAHEDAGGQTACSSDADCAAGQECEVEDNGSFCKLHGADDGVGGADDGAGGADDGAGGAATSECVTDADCPAGQECNVEDTGSVCKPHGGQGN